MKLPDIWPPDRMEQPEREQVKNLLAHLHGLTGNVEAWEAALELYKFSKTRPEFVKRDLVRRWKWIAIHECVMQLSYLDARLEVIRADRLRVCPTVKGLMDLAAYRQSNKLFEKYFPNSEKLRHAVAHMGEFDSVESPHAPPGVPFAMYRIRDDDRFEGPYEGVVYHLDITDETLARITEVVATFLRAFDPVAREFQRLGNSDE